MWVSYNLGKDLVFAGRETNGLKVFYLPKGVTKGFR